MVLDYKRRAADYICRKYDWDVIVQQTLYLYENNLVTSTQPGKGEESVWKENIMAQ